MSIFSGNNSSIIQMICLWGIGLLSKREFNRGSDYNIVANINDSDIVGNNYNILLYSNVHFQSVNLGKIINFLIAKIYGYLYVVFYMCLVIYGHLYIVIYTWLFIYGHLYTIIYIYIYIYGYLYMVICMCLFIYGYLYMVIYMWLFICA